MATTLLLLLVLQVYINEINCACGMADWYITGLHCHDDKLDLLTAILDIIDYIIITVMLCHVHKCI